MSTLSYWLAATYLPQVKPWQFLQALSFFPDIETLFRASEQDLLAAGCSNVMATAIKHPNWQQADKDLRWQNGKDRHIIPLADSAYPARLKACNDPPLLLYVYGDKSVLSCQQFAMVGTRHPTPVGIKNAQHFAAALADYGFAITSGMASGIDGACHLGALSVNGKTIAVCGTGLNTIYPAKHQILAERIIQQGALISEFALNMPVRGYNFPRRNRIISGMSVGVLVVEAAIKSGSLLTAQFALEQGREVYAIPGNIHLPQYKGCHHLIRQGAVLVETLSDIIMTLPIRNELAGKGSSHENVNLMKPLALDLTPTEQHVLAQIGYDITAFDMILLRGGLTAGELSSILLSLEMAGLIQVVPGGYVREITNN